MTGEPMHIAFEMMPHAPAISIIILTVKYPLRFVVSYVQPVTQHFGSRTVQKAPLQSMHTKRKKWCRTPWLHQLSLHCQLCSTHYTVVQVKNCLKSTSAIKIAAMKNTDDFHYKGKASCATTKSTLFAVSKDEWDTKENTGKSMKNALRYAKRHLLG